MGSVARVPSVGEVCLHQKDEDGEDGHPDPCHAPLDVFNGPVPRILRLVRADKMPAILCHSRTVRARLFLPIPRWTWAVWVGLRRLRYLRYLPRRQLTALVEGASAFAAVSVVPRGGGCRQFLPGQRALYCGTAKPNFVSAPGLG